MVTLHRRAVIALALVLTPIAIPTGASPQVPSRATAYPAGYATAEDIASVGRKPADLDWLQVEGAPDVRIAYLLVDETGTSPYTYRVRLPDGYGIFPHRHHGRLYVTVLKGTYLVGFGSTPDRAHAVAFPEGSYIWLPRRSEHFGWAVGETTIQVHGNGHLDLDWLKKEK